MRLNTTFTLLKLAGACGQKRGSDAGYDKLAHHLGGVTAYGKTTPIPLTVILDSNGLDDALWCLSAVLPEEEQERDKLARLLACDYAEHVLHIYEAKYPDDQRPRRAIEVARRYAMGDASRTELAAAWSAAGSAGSAAWSAAWSAASAASAERAWQEQRLREALS